MGIFDSLKKKQPEETPDSNPNIYLRKELGRRLQQKGHEVEIQGGFVCADRKIGVFMEILPDPALHPAVIKIGVRIVVEDYFGNGITEILAGVGDTLEQKVDSALKNLLTITLPPILEAFRDSHDPNLDFSESNHGRYILWHPKLGQLGFQGKWDQLPVNDYLFKLIKPWIQEHLSDRKFNWLKIYIARQADGSISGDCSLNNDFHEDGFKIFGEYAETWENIERFRAVKQFILFRRCDVSDK